MIMIYIFLLSTIATYVIYDYVAFIISSRNRYYDKKESSYIDETVYLTWKEIKDFYHVDPKKWSYKKVHYLQDIKHVYYKRDSYHTTVITMSPLAYAKLRFYYHFGHRKDTDAKLHVLQGVQDSIDKLRAESEVQINAANKVMKELVGRDTNDNYGASK